MDQVKKTIMGFLIGIGIYGIGIEIIGLIFSEDRMAYSLGVLFGVTVAVLLLLHITHTLNRALDMEERQATKYTTRQAFLRLGMMLAAMVVALRIPRIHFIASLLGMLGLKMGAFIASPILRRLYPDDFVTKPEDDLDSEGEEERIK